MAGPLKVAVVNFPDTQIAVGTVTVVAALTQTVAGTVAVGNFPGTQTVAGSLSITPPATQTVAGTVSVTFPATQTVAAVSVPNPVTVTGFPATQTVAGTVVVTPPATQTVAGTVIVTPPATQTVSVAVGTVVATVTFPSTQTIAGAVTVPTLQTITGGVTGAFFAATQTVAGTVAISAFPATQTIAGAVTVPALQTVTGGVTGAFFAATQTIAGAVTVPTLQTVTGGVTGAVNISGNAGAAMDAAIGGAGPTNALWTTASPATGAAAALSAKVLNAQAGGVNVKASPGNLYGLAIVNATASAGFLQFYNTATTATTGATILWPIASSGTLVLTPGDMALLNFSTGIAFWASTAVGTGTNLTVTGTVSYK